MLWNLSKSNLTKQNQAELQDRRWGSSRRRQSEEMLEELERTENKRLEKKGKQVKEYKYIKIYTARCSAIM